MNLLYKLTATNNTFIGSQTNTEYLVCINQELHEITKWARQNLSVTNDEQIISIQKISKISEGNTMTIVNLGLARRY